MTSSNVWLGLNRSLETMLELIVRDTMGAFGKSMTLATKTRRRAMRHSRASTPRFRRCSRLVGRTPHGTIRRPLYSAIAARLKLSLVKDPIPSTVEEQAKYWKEHYNTIAGAGTAAKFIEDVRHMPN